MQRLSVASTTISGLKPHCATPAEPTRTYTPTLLAPPRLALILAVGLGWVAAAPAGVPMKRSRCGANRQRVRPWLEAHHQLVGVAARFTRRPIQPWRQRKAGAELVARLAAGFGIDRQLRLAQPLPDRGGAGGALLPLWWP